MQTTVDGQMLVRDVVVRFPQARAALEALGVDYCCGGARPLAEAAKEAGVDLAQVLAAVNRAIAAPASAAESAAPDWAAASLTALADHILATHHAYMKRELPHLEALFAKVLRAHGAKHGDVLRQVHGVFTALRAEIEAHLMKEEQVLFPCIAEMDAQVAATRTVPPMHCGTIRNPIRQMEAEHENAGEALAAMRRITGGYALPDDACPTFAALYEGLQRMEADLHQHVHLENNILYPRAIEMEAAG